jgi:hypothetical protein
MYIPLAAVRLTGNHLAFTRSLRLDLRSHGVDDRPGPFVRLISQHIDDISPNLFFELDFDDHGRRSTVGSPPLLMWM